MLRGFCPNFRSLTFALCSLYLPEDSGFKVFGFRASLGFTVQCLGFAFRV